MAALWKAEVHLGMVCQSPLSLGFLFFRWLTESHSLKQSDVVHHVSGRFRSWSVGPGRVRVLGRRCAVAQSTLSDPQQMWGPITLQTVISGKGSSLQQVARSRCWNGNDKSCVWFCFSEQISTNVQYKLWTSWKVLSDAHVQVLILVH